MSVTATNPEAVPARERVVPAGQPPLHGELIEHSYDGIQEYDNPLPSWWRMVFYGTIVFSGFYALYFYAFGWGTTPFQAYRAEAATYEAKRALREAADAAAVDEDVLARDAHDRTITKHGAQLFSVRCVACHTDNGRGLIGPNLTDLYQLHGTTRMDLYHTIHDGVPGTAMLAWGEQLAPADIVSLAAFVSTLRGQNIAGKAPEGQPVQPFEP